MIKTIRGFMKRLNEDHVGAYAAQSAYFILLSFIPFVLLVVTLVKGHCGTDKRAEQHLSRNRDT